MNIVGLTHLLKAGNIRHPLGNLLAGETTRTPPTKNRLILLFTVFEPTRLECSEKQSIAYGSHKMVKWNISDLDI